MSMGEVVVGCVICRSHMRERFLETISMANVPPENWLTTANHKKSRFLGYISGGNRCRGQDERVPEVADQCFAACVGVLQYPGCKTCTPYPPSTQCG